MNLNPHHCYQALLTRDPRFDGRFFIAVKTTRIYCRPICRVKPPLQKNCTFFTHAAAAEAAGFRPCKRCRPELAPGKSPLELSSHHARAAAFHIGEAFLADRSLADLAAKLAITDRQLRRVFHAEFGVSPVEFWQTQRLLLAKQLLTDTTLPVTRVALAAGFQSLRRFNALLKARYRLSPTELRRHHKDRACTESTTESPAAFRLSYRPPLAWNHLLNFLAHRAIPGIEAVRDDTYSRTLQLRPAGRTFAGTLEVQPHPTLHLLSVRLSDNLLPVCATILERLKRLFDLHADPAAIDRTLGPLAAKTPGLRVPGCFDPFEMAVRAILGQQISVAGARTLAGRLVQHFGAPLQSPLATPTLTHLFPTPQQLAAASPQQLTSLGITSRRAHTLITLAQTLARGTLTLEPGRAIPATLAQLRQIPGIGELTCQYIAMRSLNDPDAFPHTDLGIQKALAQPHPKRILALAEKWRPWRAYATLHLWSQLEKPQPTPRP